MNKTIIETEIEKFNKELYGNLVNSGLTAKEFIEKTVRPSLQRVYNQGVEDCIKALPEKFTGNTSWTVPQNNIIELSKLNLQALKQGDE